MTNCLDRRMGDPVNVAEVTRDEFQMLRDAVNANAARLDQIDVSGTRGVGALAVQVSELIKDLTELKQAQTGQAADVRASMAAHERQHYTEAQARTSRIRWAWGFGVAAFTALWAPLLWLMTHVHR